MGGCFYAAPVCALPTFPFQFSGSTFNLSTRRRPELLSLLRGFFSPCRGVDSPTEHQQRQFGELEQRHNRDAGRWHEQNADREPAAGNQFFRLHKP
jgi:hypothetical protein